MAVISEINILTVTMLAVIGFLGFLGLGSISSVMLSARITHDQERDQMREDLKHEKNF